ncbi:hypothetical protein FisN_29Lh069 [Fistulifera solaris]|uniref:Uncharacterized protein n=1 Tax=Fistulifera solaris TaxID=1519565 RepID=A0A1Z5JLG2_FISSO|nr:hypothetical protein FisN_29Lh069 [Fistulifera solaris]|eukprot:GAX14857.1 hypothetical protein FisN_29Lh069 [Fistulifera solaris]
MPPPPSRMNQEEGEVGEIQDAPPPRSESHHAMQRYSSAASAGSYASLALDPPSHLQPSITSDDNRRGRSFPPPRGGRGREPGRFGPRYGGREDHRPPPLRARPENGISSEFSTGLSLQRGAPVMARGRGVLPGGRYPARGPSTGRWVGGRERIPVPDQDASQEPGSNYSSGRPISSTGRGGRGSVPMRGGRVEGRGRSFPPRGGVFEGRGRPLPSRGRTSEARGFPSTARGGIEGRGQLPPVFSHRPSFPEAETKRTYSDLVNEPPQFANTPEPKRIRSNPSFGSEGEIVPQKQELSYNSLSYPAASQKPMHPGSAVEHSESFSSRGRPPPQDSSFPRQRASFPPAPPMHPSTQPHFRQLDRGSSLASIDNRHSMDRPGLTRGPVLGNRPAFDASSLGQGNVESSFNNRSSNSPYDRSNRLNSSIGPGDGMPKRPPPSNPGLDYPGPPRETGWRAMNGGGVGGGPPQGQEPTQGMAGAPPQEVQRQFPPTHSVAHRSEIDRGGFSRGGPGRGYFPGRGDGRGRAMRAREILAGRGGDILGGRDPPVPPPFVTYDEYGSRPPAEYGGGRGGSFGGRDSSRMTSRPPHASLGWSGHHVPQRSDETNTAKTVALPAPPPAPESPKPKRPEPAEPSGFVTALTRLADLEAQMEYEFAKHMQLVIKHKELKAQYQLLERLPVGIDAIKDDLARLENKASA